MTNEDNTRQEREAMLAESQERATEQRATEEGYGILKLKNIGIYKIKSPKLLKKLKLVYESGDFHHHATYNLHTFVFGEGQQQQLLLTESNVNLPEGDGLKYLSPTIITEADDIYNNPPSFEVVKLIAKILGIKYKDKPLYELWEEIISKPLTLYRLSSPLSLDSLTELKNSDNQTITKIVDYYLTEGNEIDDRILLSAKMDFLSYNKEYAVPEHIVPYNPHGILVTNTKTAKSTTYEKVGEKRERCSMAGSLGFSTGSESNQGDLDGQMGSYAHDEVQEEERHNVIQQTLVVMETGKASVSVGRKTIHTSTCAILNFLTNPKEIENSKDYFNPKLSSIGAFRRTLEKLSDNYKALGSRTAKILYGNDFISVRGSQLDYNTSSKLRAVVESIKEEVGAEFTKLMLNSEVHEWLNSDLPSDYVTKIKQTCGGICINEVKEFWLGHTEAHRHIRGGALRRACVDFLADIWKRDFKLEKILEKAENYLRQILNLNLKSLGKMAEISETYLEGFWDRLLESCQPDYLRHLILVLLKYHELHPEANENYVLFDELKETFDMIQNKDELFGGKYSRWNELKAKFQKVRQKNQTKLINDFGIQTTAVEGLTAFNILDLAKFNSLYATDLEKKVVLQTGGVNGVNGVNGVKSEEITPFTPKTPTTPPSCKGGYISDKEHKPPTWVELKQAGYSNEEIQDILKEWKKHET